MEPVTQRLWEVMTPVVLGNLALRCLSQNHPWPGGVPGSWGPFLTSGKQHALGFPCLSLHRLLLRGPVSLQGRKMIRNQDLEVCVLTATSTPPR